jgi:23S rRNA (cytosine1962-C5)-methyltransferase
MEDHPVIILKSGKDQSLKRFHPWVFSGAIKKIKGNLTEGQLVKVYSNHEEYLGTGHYQIGSIAIRILTFADQAIDENFWEERIAQAIALRQKLGLLNSNNNVCRLVHAEGDGLPGLIIDFYNGTAVIQMHSVGMYLNTQFIVNALKNVMGSQLKAIFNKSEGTLPFKANLDAKNGYLFGDKETGTVIENGIQFRINWEEGQKTGFFIDQRENRELVEKYSQGKKVLNMFCYTGGFSVYALRGQAECVHSVDSSKPAIEQTIENIALNFEQPAHEAYAKDAFDFLEGIDGEYDLIILDPPAFAKHNDVLHNALQGYKRLNAKAISKIKKGGILFTFSCSQVVSKETFKKTLFVAAANTGRQVKILHQLSQPPDHPVNIYHPEGEYLKGLVLEIS